MSRREKRKKGVLGKIIIILFLIVIIACLSVCLWYNLSLKSVQSESQKVSIEIAEGSGVSDIAETLKTNGLIKDANAFKIYCKLNKRTLMQAGKYELDKNMSVDEIITQLENGNVIDETLTLTFPEGKNMRWLVSEIASKTSTSETDIYNLLSDDEYLDTLIDEYWFLSDDIKDEDIYYSLEGYLYPDTYIFENKDVSPEIIFDKMLSKTDSVLSEYKTEINKSDYSVHEILTLASVVELEATNEEDRAGVASVLINRLDSNMALQSDVTTYYALKLDMGERDLTASDLETKSPYNTRLSSMAGKLPVGPICMVSESSIKAVLEPDNTDYLYFVADKNGKVYFSETNEEHEQKIQELKDNDLWYTY